MGAGSGAGFRVSGFELKVKYPVNCWQFGAAIRDTAICFSSISSILGSC